MKNYKIIICYDGTDFNGWQKQGSTKNTIQGILENIIFKLTGEQTQVNGSGRTDAGTHAIGQSANFKLSNAVDCGILKSKINKYLPPGIAVKSCEEADMRFHARLNAKQKTYIYRIDTGEVPNVFERRYMLRCTGLDVGKMREAKEYFIGEHNFTAFCSNKKSNKSYVRTIYNIDITEKGNEIVLSFTGNGFLYNMVRIMTGTLIEVGEGKRNPEDIESIIKSRDRQNSGFTAPACGLTLKEVRY